METNLDVESSYCKEPATQTRNQTRLDDKRWAYHRPKTIQNHSNTYAFSFFLFPFGSNVGPSSEQQGTQNIAAEERSVGPFQRSPEVGCAPVTRLAVAPVAPTSCWGAQMGQCRGTAVSEGWASPKQRKDIGRGFPGWFPVLSVFI